MLSATAITALLTFGTSVQALARPGHPLTARHEEGDCSVQPAGSGPVTNNPDTAEAFQANPIYAQSANGATTPSGYSLAYQNLLAATTTTGYLGFEYLSSYDPGYCAAQCTNSWKGCDSFNIYYERDPTLDSGVNCPDPASLTYIKCSYWSSCLDETSATNDGQYCQDFHVVIAGSNGYTANSVCPSSTTPSSSAPTPSLTACPQPVGYIISGPERTLYANCIDTDFQIPSPQIYYGVQDNRACGILCDQQAGCTKAVFNLGTQTCYLKDSPSVSDSNWHPNPGFQTIERIPDGTPITSCPNPYSIVQSGVKWTVCPATSFNECPTLGTWHHVAGEYDCAALCQKTWGCQKFVYNWNTQTCYNKGNPALSDTKWAVQSGVGAYYMS